MDLKEGPPRELLLDDNERFVVWSLMQGVKEGRYPTSGNFLKSWQAKRRALQLAEHELRPDATTEVFVLTGEPNLELVYRTARYVKQRGPEFVAPQYRPFSATVNELVDRLDPQEES